MKIIVTHDVDHLYVSEHFGDLIIPKFIVRAFIELVTFRISIDAFVKRMWRLFQNRWHRIPELVEFNKEQGIPATFYWGMGRGRGLCYSAGMASPLIKYVMENGMGNGVHGIEAENQEMMQLEHDQFKSYSGLTDFGIRMHYLKKGSGTLAGLAQSGYSHDSSEFGLLEPYRIGSMWEIPLSLMEGYLFEGGNRWQTRNLKQARNETIEMLNHAVQMNLPYFVILFHDRYFDMSFPEWKMWYIWFIGYSRSKGFEFISMKDAVAELNNSRQSRLI